jgi:O-antigen/teichoic acid export membrane protein
MTLKSMLLHPPPSTFRRNFIRVARANVVALVVPLLATPLLTRLYPPSDYGQLAIFTAVATLIGAVCTWRFDWVIPNAASRGTAAAMGVAGVSVVAGACIATTLIVLWLRAERDVPPLWWLLPVGVAGIGARALLSGWFVRCNDLAPTSRATIAQSLSNTTFALVGGITQAGALGLVLANVAAAWMGIGSMARRSGDLLWRPLRRVTARRVRAAVRPHLPNASWSTLVSIVNAASLNLPILLLALLFDAREVGWYAMMQRVVLVPTKAFTSALGGSFWAHAADHARHGRFRELAADYRRVTSRLAVASLPIIGICLAGPWMVGPLLGEAQWGGAGWVLLAMSPLFVGSLVFAPTNHLVVLDRQRLQLAADAVRLAGTALAIWIAHRLELGFVIAVGAASAASCLGHVAMFIVHSRIHRAHR